MHLLIKQRFAVINDATIAIVNITAVAIVIVDAVAVVIDVAVFNINALAVINDAAVAVISVVEVAAEAYEFTHNLLIMSKFISLWSQSLNITNSEQSSHSPGGSHQRP